MSCWERDRPTPYLLRHAKIVDFRTSQVAAWAVRAAIGVRLAPNTPRSRDIRTEPAVGDELGGAAVVVTSAKVRDLRLRGSATAQSCAQRGPGVSFYVCEGGLGAMGTALST